MAFILTLYNTETGEHQPLDARVEQARAGYQLITLPGIGRILVGPAGRIMRALRVARVMASGVGDA